MTNGHVLVELGDYTWPNTHPRYNWCHQINGVTVRVWELSKICISLSAPIADVIVDRIEVIHPHYWLYGHVHSKGPSVLLITNMKGKYAMIGAPI